MAKPKKQETLRQQMRVVAASQLEKILDQAYNALVDSVKEHSKDVLDHGDVARLLVGGQTKTLRTRMVGLLANEAEQVLIELWNKQGNLDLGEPDAK